MSHNTNTQACTKPLVSAVICTYKRAHLVERAIRSVQAQTYPNIEIVVVDDASPDNTQEALSAIADVRLRIVRNETNLGLAASRNAGVRASKGEYVAFLDDDDEWYTAKIEKQVEFLTAHSCDAVAVLTASVVNGHRLVCFRETAVTADVLRRGNPFLPGSGLLARTAVLKEIPFDERVGQGEDWDVLIRISHRHKIGYIREPLYNVSDGSHNRMTNQARNLSLDALEKRMAVLHKHREFFGRYWYRHHVAGSLLSYFRSRHGRVEQVGYAIRRCGVIPVAAVLGKKILRAIRRRLIRA